MDWCVSVAKDSGLENACWTGQTGLEGTISNLETEIVERYAASGGRLAGSYAFNSWDSAVSPGV